jgi:tetratricopeptide (TPR) repeat protein
VRAAALLKDKRWDELEGVCQELLARNPENFDALRLLAFGRMQAKRYERALGAATRALKLRPKAWKLAGLRGDALAALGRNKVAVTAYDRALALQPERPALLFGRGKALRALGRHQEALDTYDRALALRPDSPAALLNRGNEQRSLGRIEDSIESFRRALELRPEYVDAFNNLGNALQSIGRYAEAVENYRSALRIKPNYIAALNNQGNALMALGRYEEAIALHDRVLAMEPDRAAAKWNKGTAMLSLGLSREAWLMYEHRLQTPMYKGLPKLGLPLLSGKPPKGAKVLVQWEARFGDIIQMLRYVPALQESEAECWLQVARPLRELAARSFPQARIVGLRQAGQATCRIPFTSLPLAMETFSEAAIPSAVPYLVPDAAKVEHWKQAVGRGGAPRIGVAWRGNPVPAQRSIALDALQPIFETSQAQFVTLQKGLTAEERAILKGRANVTVLDEELASFDDTAAVVAGLDLMITIDSAVAHLAGALARPTWVLLKLGSDWRWMSDREDTPWYPTARLFRQAVLGDWGPVVRRVCDELAHLPGKQPKTKAPRPRRAK